MLAGCILSVLPMPGATGIGMNVGSGLGVRNNQALDTLIANNAISSDSPGPGIRIAAGGGAGSANLLDGVQIIANQIHVTGHVPSSSQQPSGIWVVSGDAASDDQFPSLRPIQYSENNIARNIGILSNTIDGAVGFGVTAMAACCGNASNEIDNLSILGNTMTGGVQLTGGASGGYLSQPSAGNSLSNVLVQANSIQKPTLSSGYGSEYTFESAIQGAGIGVWAGSGGTGNSVNGISIANNDVNTPSIGISIVAGYGFPGLRLSLPTGNNVVSAAQVFCNQVDQAPTRGVTPSSGIKGINVVAGVDVANGNLVQQLSVHDNLVAGVLNDASLFANLGTGASGNSISISKISVPGSCDPRISPMLWTTCRFTPPGRGR